MATGYCARGCGWYGRGRWVSAIGDRADAVEHPGCDGRPPEREREPVRTWLNPC